MSQDETQQIRFTSTGYSSTSLWPVVRRPPVPWSAESRSSTETAKGELQEGMKVSSYPTAGQLLDDNGYETVTIRARGMQHASRYRLTGTLVTRTSIERTFCARSDS